MDLSQVLLAPVVTEKSVQGEANGCYTFYVRKGTNKVEVKHAVKSLYGLEVASVNMIKNPSKERVVGRGKIRRKRPEILKARITLKDKTKKLDFGKIKDKK